MYSFRTKFIAFLRHRFVLSFTGYAQSGKSGIRSSHSRNGKNADSYIVSFLPDLLSWILSAWLVQLCCRRLDGGKQATEKYPFPCPVVSNSKYFPLDSHHRISVLRVNELSWPNVGRVSPADGLYRTIHPVGYTMKIFGTTVWTKGFARFKCKMLWDNWIPMMSNLVFERE